MKHSESVVNPSIRMYINRIENRITFKLKNGYYLELLTPETIKLIQEYCLLLFQTKHLVVY